MLIEGLVDVRSVISIVVHVAVDDSVYLYPSPGNAYVCCIAEVCFNVSGAVLEYFEGAQYGNYGLKHDVRSREGVSQLVRIRMADRHCN